MRARGVGTKGDIHIEIESFGGGDFCDMRENLVGALRPTKLLGVSVANWCRGI
ncbi:hypothetical protein EMGBS4_17640 [Acidimicrobiaceae bacterium]|nr:hypothetical protein EMGBS4_17640 [Acidimicrobiaceae bacterium]